MTTVTSRKLGTSATICVTLIALLVSLPGQLRGQQKDPALDLYYLATGAYNRKLYPAAIGGFREFLQKHGFIMHHIHGCAYGLVGQNDHKGEPILKPWTIATTCPTDYLYLSSRCPGKSVHPNHAPCEANETKLTEDYTWLLVNAIHKAHSHHVSKEVPGPRRVINIKEQGQDKDKRKEPATTSGYPREDSSTVMNFNEKTCDSDCPVGPSQKSEVNVHVGPASRCNVKVDSFDCHSISALTLLDASAHTLEAARQSCLKLENDMMEQKNG